MTTQERSPGRSRLWVALAAVPVLLLGLGACADGDGGGPPYETLWSLDGQTVGGGEHIRPTTWATGTTVAITRAQEVTGYDAATGARRWAVPLAGRVCSASERPAGDRVAVHFGVADRRCDRVAVIDLKSGQKVWERAIGPSVRISGSRVVIVDDVVVVNRLRHGVDAFRLADGRPLWRNAETGADCGYRGLADGPALVTGWNCRASLRQVRRVEGLAPDTGKTLWRYETPPDLIVDSLVSSRPVVIGLRSPELAARLSRLVVLDTAGKQTASIEIDNDHAVNCPRNLWPSSHCNNVVVTDDALYIRSGTGPDAKDKGQEPVVAYDLDTGRARWSTENPDGRQLYPLGMDGDRLIAAQPLKSGGASRTGRRTKPPRLVSVHPATGKTSIIGSVPLEANTLLGTHGHRRYVQQRLFLTSRLVSGREEAVFRAYGVTGG